MARETKKQRIQRLAYIAMDLDAEINHLEDTIRDTVKEIKDLNPSKKQTDEFDLEYLFKCYYF